MSHRLQIMNVGGIDGTSRLAGGSLLLIGAVLALPGIGAHTAETFALWLALIVGMTALIAALRGHCSWYAGILVTGSTMLLLAIRGASHPAVDIIVVTVSCVVALLALYTRVTRVCPVNRRFRLSSR